MIYIAALNNLDGNNDILISFILNLNDTLFQKNEDFCLDLKITIDVPDNNVCFENIRIDISSIKRLIMKINNFVQNDLNELDYSPLEADFTFHLIPNKQRLSDTVENLKKYGYSQDSIHELDSMEETFNMIFFVDRCKYEKGFNSNTGLAYWIKVSKRTLANFSNELSDELDLLINRDC